MTDPRRTPLFSLHEARKARIVDFAGYAMPVQYTGGIIREHDWTRRSAGLFDVSHMGQLIVRPKDGDIVQAARALESIIPSDVVGLPVGRQRYCILTNDSGGILDDLMIANRGNEFLLVLNASRKVEDTRHIRKSISSSCDLIAVDDRALVALQGPMSEAALARIVPGVAEMRFMDSASLAYGDGQVWVSRSGYTGEDGFEISVEAERAVPFVESLEGLPEVELAGLGARDSLRLEAGLCLYGSDIDATTSPVEARIGWSIPKVRREGGTRSGGYPGHERIASDFADGTDRVRIGLRPEGRAPMRPGTELFANSAGDRVIGLVTSGGFGPTIGAPVAMGYVTAEHGNPGTRIFGRVRGKYNEATVVNLPFVKANFKRK